jgi:hypothetical protein
MIPHWAGNADAARWALGLKPCRHVHRIAVQVSSIGNRVAEVDPHTKADCSVRGLFAIQDRHLLLHL